MLHGVEVRGPAEHGAVEPAHEEGEGEFVEVRERERLRGRFAFARGAEEGFEVRTALAEQVGVHGEGFAALAGEERGHSWPGWFAERC